MARKFNPPPGWDVHYGFEPPEGWQPDPDWPAAPPGWPLWLGKDDVYRRSPIAQADGDTLWYVNRGLGPSNLLTQARGQGLSRPPAGREEKPRAIRYPYLLLALVALVACLAGTWRMVGPGSGRSAPNASARPPQPGVFSLRVGDCFDSPALAVLRQGIAPIASRSCQARHDAQVFARFWAAGQGGYPGRTALSRQAHRGCSRRLSAVHETGARRSLRVIGIYPDEVAWFNGGRAIYCVVRAPRRDLRTSLVTAATPR